MDAKPSFLEKLRSKWKVHNILQVVLILCTFAIGGSLCAFLGRTILAQFDLNKNALWYLIYILLVTLLWPICVLVISIPFGQFAFFKSYLAKMGRRMTGRKS